jgi:hypothetical protein
MEDSE